MSDSTSDIARDLASWRAKREEAKASQEREQAEDDRRSTRQQARNALIGCHNDLATRKKSPPSWKEWASEYAALLCAWVALWDIGEVSAIQNLRPLSQKEEQLHPGMIQARTIAVCLILLARESKQDEVCEVLICLEHEHELRGLVVTCWLHGRLTDEIARDKRADRVTADRKVQAESQSRAGVVGPAVDYEDERILRALAKTTPRLQTQDQIATESDVSRRTISNRMKHLLADGLVAQPKGPKSGTTITDNGRNMLKQIEAAKAAR